MLPRLIHQYGAEQILFMDESGVNSNEVARYGWSPRSERCKALIPGGHGKRISLIGAVRMTSSFKFLAPVIFDGYCDRSVFGSWLEHLSEALPKYENGDMKQHVLILDNASFHKGKQIESMAKAYNIRLFYLPAYCPHLNPVERCWSVLKTKLRQLRSKGFMWDECFDQAFFQM